MPKALSSFTGESSLSTLVGVDDALLLVVLRASVVAEFGHVELLVGDEGAGGHPLVKDSVGRLEMVEPFLPGDEAVGDGRALLSAPRLDESRRLLLS